MKKFHRVILKHDLKDAYGEIYYHVGEQVRAYADPTHPGYPWRIGGFYVARGSFTMSQKASRKF